MTRSSDWKNGGPSMDRRGALECMVWAGTGMLWALSGGIPKSMFIGDAEAAETAKSSFTFLQISDSHIGFNKPENPDALGTLQEAIAKIKAMLSPSRATPGSNAARQAVSASAAARAAASASCRADLSSAPCTTSGGRLQASRQCAN